MWGMTEWPIPITTPSARQYKQPLDRSRRRKRTLQEFVQKRLFWRMLLSRKWVSWIGNCEVGVVSLSLSLSLGIVMSEWFTGSITWKTKPPTVVQPWVCECVCVCCCLVGSHGQEGLPRQFPTHCGHKHKPDQTRSKCSIYFRKLTTDHAVYSSGSDQAQHRAQTKQGANAAYIFGSR